MSNNSTPDVPQHEVPEKTTKSIPAGLIIGSIFILALIGAVALFMIFPYFQ